MTNTRIGIMGARGLMGGLLCALALKEGLQVTGLSRVRVAPEADGIAWRDYSLPIQPAPGDSSPRIEQWISVIPIWALVEHIALLEAYGVRRIVALSSTSRYSKIASSNRAEQSIARRIADAEVQLQAWASSKGIEWVILRPTLIYGLGRDKNIAEIARFVRRFGFFPLLGAATGLRQPLRAEDLSHACMAALRARAATNKAYNLSGAESISYREMVARVFATVGKPVRLVTVPLMLFRVAVALFRIFPRYRHLSASMAERMNESLVFDHTDAARDLGFKPGPFVLDAEDVMA